MTALRSRLSPLTGSQIVSSPVSHPMPLFRFGRGRLPGQKEPDVPLTINGRLGYRGHFVVIHFFNAVQYFFFLYRCQRSHDDPFALSCPQICREGSRSLSSLAIFPVRGVFSSSGSTRADPAPSPLSPSSHLLSPLVITPLLFLAGGVSLQFFGGGVVLR